MKYKNFVKTDVTAVKFINDFIYIGIAGILYKYTLKGQLLSQIQLFAGQNIYGIVPDALESLIVYGGPKIKIVCNDLSNLKSSPNGQNHFDWILDAKWIDNSGNIALISMKNVTSIYTSNEFKLIKKVRCNEKCILYSACLCYDTWQELIVLCGTVFGEVLILRPSISEKSLYRITGHNGVIFSVSYNKQLGIICTTSDDRSVRIWDVKNKNLSSELEKSTVTITNRHVLYGHLSRVWDNCILSDKIVTIGEDSQAIIWNLRDGCIKRRFNTHQGGCIWSMDCLESKNIIVTGGGDSGVSLHSIDQNFNFETISIQNNENPRHVCLLRSGNYAVITENGVLMYYSRTQKLWHQLECHEDLKSYCLLEISSCRNLIALAGFHANIHLYKETKNSMLITMCSYTIPENYRIYSIHWLNCKQILTCGPNGLLCLWTIKNENELEFICKFFLPPSKERWSTTACFCGNNFIAVGDRKGNVNLFSLNKSEACCNVWKAHNYLGVSKLYYGKNCLLSLGRNSTLNEYYFDEGNKCLSVTSKDKLPFKWLANMYQDDSNTILVGFCGKDFSVWDHKSRRIIINIPCGGGHRSWDFRKSDAKFSFIYLKDKTCNYLEYDWNDLNTLNIIEGFHIKETNACDVAKIDSNNFLIISGSEDTTIRLSCLEIFNASCEFWNVQILKSHLSSIRCLTILELEKGEFLLFSGGGRAQVILWKLYVQDEFTCRELDNFYEPCLNEEGEIRIMSIASKSYNQSCAVLATACSDGNIKLYEISYKDFKIKYLTNLFYKIKCILQVGYLELNFKTLLFCTATDGCLIFWDMTNKNNLRGKNWKVLENIHQSGINSVSNNKILEDTFAFLTGGDDNKISFFVVQFQLLENDDFKVEIKSSYENSIAHCAQVTGTYIAEKHFFTASIDQKLQIFSWTLDTKFSLEVHCVHTYYTAVSDIKGLHCVLENENEIAVFVHGNGIDVCRFNK